MPATITQSAGNPFVIERIKAHILTEKNRQELVRLTNEEIKQSKGMYQERLTAIEGQIGDAQGRLNKLYDALETGKLELDDLAPRIKDLKGRINELEGQQLNMLEHMQEAKIELLGRTKVKTYVDDLRTLLSRRTLIEQKAFLRSFVKRVKLSTPALFSPIPYP
jgi:chromosome segregation ATPase